MSLGELHAELESEQAMLRRLRREGPYDGGGRHLDATRENIDAIERLIAEKSRPPREQILLRLGRDPSQLDAFVARTKGNWNHQDWLGLLSGLRNAGYSPLDEQRVGGLLEQRREEWRRRERREAADHESRARAAEEKLREAKADKVAWEIRELEAAMREKCGVGGDMDRWRALDEEVKTLKRRLDEPPQDPGFPGWLMLVLIVGWLVALVFRSGTGWLVFAVAVRIVVPLTRRSMRAMERESDQRSLALQEEDLQRLWEEVRARLAEADAACDADPKIVALRAELAAIRGR